MSHVYKRLSPADVFRLLMDRRDGATYDTLAKNYGVTYRTVYSICNGLTHVSKRAIELINDQIAKRKGPAAALPLLKAEARAKKFAA